MFSLRMPIILALAAALAAPAWLDAPAAQAAPARRTAKKAAQKRASRPARQARSRRDARRGKKARPKVRLVCKKGKCSRRRGRFVSHGVARSELRSEPLPRPSGEIHAYNPNFDLEVRVNIYNPDGSYNQQALATLDRLFRCRLTREDRAVDPRLYEILSLIYDHFDGRRINLSSGFRYQLDEGSRHYHASAMDLRIPGVAYKDIYDYVETLDLGGMGIGQYPRSAFVHIDFRAPGQPSIRWTDTSSKKKGKRKPNGMWRVAKRTS